MSKKYYVYILICSDGSYYTGSTSALEQRLNQHNSGTADGYTQPRRPVQLVFHTEYDNPVDDINMERRIKKWSRAKKEALIERKFDLLHDLAKCKNETNSKFK